MKKMFLLSLASFFFLFIGCTTPYSLKKMNIGMFFFIDIIQGIDITTVNSNNNVGTYTSLKLNSEDNPVISYFDETSRVLNIAICHNSICSSANFTIFNRIGHDSTGTYNSLQLNSAGTPMASYPALGGGHGTVRSCFIFKL